jgi:hypothetical protein
VSLLDALSNSTPVAVKDRVAHLVERIREQGHLHLGGPQGEPLVHLEALGAVLAVGGVLVGDLAARLGRRDGLLPGGGDEVEAHLALALSSGITPCSSAAGNSGTGGTTPPPRPLADRAGTAERRRYVGRTPEAAGWVTTSAESCTADPTLR